MIPTCIVSGIGTYSRTGLLWYWVVYHRTVDSTAVRNVILRSTVYCIMTVDTIAVHGTRILTNTRSRQSTIHNTPEPGVHNMHTGTIYSEYRSTPRVLQYYCTTVIALTGYYSSFQFSPIADLVVPCKRSLTLPPSLTTSAHLTSTIIDLLLVIVEMRLMFACTFL